MDAIYIGSAEDINKSLTKTKTLYTHFSKQAAYSVHQAFGHSPFVVGRSFSYGK